MRVMVAGVALASLVGAILAVLRGNWTAAALCSLGFWAGAWVFVSYINARSKVDNMLDEEDE